jgi:hypothetical protein
MMGDLIKHTQPNHHKPPHRAVIKRSIPSTFSTPTANHAARESVRWKYKVMEASGVYGRIESDKPNNVIRLMYEKFSSLSLFAEGNTRHKKIRQINKLMQDYGVDILAGCKTRTDWQYVTSEEDKLHNLFCRGKRTQGVAAHDTNDGKIRRDQIGGTCMTRVGRLGSSVIDSGSDLTGLGRWCWIQIGGGGKNTRVVTAYQPMNP